MSAKSIQPKLVRLQKVASTNTVAANLAKEGAAEGTVVVAEAQTRGKGRLNRAWFSPKGGLWFSVVLKPKIKPQEAFKLNFAASVAVARTLRTLTGLAANVKWPNDVLIEGQKVCGVLTETRVRKGILDYAVVGVGLNSNVQVESFPETLRGYATSLESKLGRKLDNESLLQGLLEEFFTCYALIGHGGFEILLREWKHLAAFLGSQIEVHGDGRLFVAKALDVDAEGRLLVRLENGMIQKLVFGDVSVGLKQSR